MPKTSEETVARSIDVNSDEQKETVETHENKANDKYKCFITT